MLKDTQISEMYKEGHLVKDIAKKDGRSVGTIYRLLKNTNTKVKDHRSNADIDKIISLYEGGLSSRCVAKLTNTSSGHVRKIIKKHSVPREGYEAFGIKKEELDIAIDNYTGGEGARTASKNFNFSEKAVYNELKRRGEKVRGYSEANCLSNTSKRKRGLKGSLEVESGMIKFESFYELLFIVQSLKDTNIVKVERSKEIIPYMIDNKLRYYNPDFLLTYKNNETCTIEIKPKLRVEEEINVLKKDAAITALSCYKIVTEDDLILYNISTLNDYKIKVKEDIQRYIKRYKNKINNEL